MDKDNETNVNIDVPSTSSSSSSSSSSTKSDKILPCSSSSSPDEQSTSGIKRTLDDDDDDDKKVTKSSKLKNNDNNDDIDDDDDVIDLQTAAEMLECEIGYENDSMCLYGGLNPNQCTYIDGYAPRQPLFICYTCETNKNPETGEYYKAGICYGCIENCHDGHHVEELYTKRNFCCDCGNEKFANLKCKLFHKVGFNDENEYSKNFSGFYCNCLSTLYAEDFKVMRSCAICEDWFHSEHLDEYVEEVFNEMVCVDCVKTHDFLVYYKNAGLFELKEFDDYEEYPKEFAEMLANLDKRIAESESRSKECQLIGLKAAYKEKYGDEKVDPSHCKTLFMPIDWRLIICRCPSCIEMYKNSKIPFITDVKDMAIVYCHQNRLKDIKENKYAKKLDNHVIKIEIMKKYNLFKKEVCDFIQREAEEGKRVITQEDMKKFIEELKQRLFKKKPKTSFLQNSLF